MIDIIIINWNSGNQLGKVISSISKNHHSLVAAVIIVDNASTDTSLSQVENIKEFPFPLVIIRNETNRGFGAACNQAAKLATSDYLLFLNPDTCLFDNSLSTPLAFLQNNDNQKVGIVGIQLVDENNCIARSCARFPSWCIIFAQAFGVNRLPLLQHLNIHMEDWPHNSTCEVDHVIGAYYLIRHTLFKSLHGFDELFFVYLEDLDLSLRAQQKGYQTVYLTESQAFHAGGGTSHQVKARRLFYSLRSRIFYGIKHFDFIEAIAVIIITMIFEPFTRSLHSLVRCKAIELSNIWQAYSFLASNFSDILKKGKEIRRHKKKCLKAI